MSNDGSNKSSLNAFLPVIGLLLALALGAVAYVLSGPAHDFLMQNVSGVPDQPEVQYVVAGVLWLLLLLLSGMIYAMFAPKPTKTASEAQLKKEKIEMQKEAVARKKRQQEINRNMAREREAREKQGTKKR
jgi:membrane protein implicated in regulation of membrane protease activity